MYTPVKLRCITQHVIQTTWVSKKQNFNMYVLEINVYAMYGCMGIIILYFSLTKRLQKFKVIKEVI